MAEAVAKKAAVTTTCKPTVKATKTKQKQAAPKTAVAPTAAAALNAAAAAFVPGTRAHFAAKHAMVKVATVRPPLHFRWCDAMADQC